MKNIVPFLIKRESGLRLKASDRRIGDALVENKATEPTINEPFSLSGQTRSTFVMAFSPDGTKVASSHGDHTVRVSDIATGECLHVLKGHPRTPWSIAFHPSSNDILASGCLGGDVRIWDLKGGGSELWKVPNATVIASLTFHPSDHLLVVASANVIYFWDWNLPQPIVSRSTNNDYEQVRWVKFDPLGQYLFTGIANGSTLQRDDSLHHTSHFGYMNEGPYSEVHRSGLRRRQYYDLLSRYNQHQRETHGTGQNMSQSVHTSAGRTSSTHSGTTYTQSHTRRNPLDIDVNRATSPTHLTALDDARQYASIVSNMSNTTSQPSRHGVPRSLLSSRTRENSSTEPRTSSSAVSSSQSTYHGSWRYVSRGPNARPGIRLSDILRNRNSRAESNRDVATSSATETIRANETNSNEDRKTSSADQEAEKSACPIAGKKEAKKVNCDSDSSSSAAQTSSKPDSNGTPGSSSSNSSGEQSSILLSHLSSSSENNTSQSESPASSSTSTSSSGTSESSESTSASQNSTSDSNVGEIRSNSLLRSWLESSRSSATGDSGDLSSSDFQEPQRQTARFVTVIRPPPVSLPVILGSQPPENPPTRSEHSSPGATNQRSAFTSIGSRSNYCEQCINSRNLVMQESLPRPPRVVPCRFVPCRHSDVGCETDESKLDSRTVGTETHKSKGCRSPKADGRASKKFKPSNKSCGSTQSQASSSGECSSCHKEKKESDSNAGSCSSSSGAVKGEALKSEQKTGNDSVAKSLKRRSTGDDEPPRKRFKTDPSQMDQSASGPSSEQSKSAGTRRGFSEDAVPSSSVETAGVRDNAKSEPLPNPFSRSRFSAFSATPTNSHQVIHRRSASSGENTQSSLPWQNQVADGNSSEHTRANCRHQSPGRNTSTTDTTRSQMHTDLYRRYHRLQDFRRRILDIHDRLQQRRHQSVERLRAHRILNVPRNSRGSLSDRLAAYQQERLRDRSNRMGRPRVPGSRASNQHSHVIPDITITRPPDSPPGIIEPIPVEDPLMDINLNDDRQEMLRDLENMRMEAMRARHAAREQERLWHQQQMDQGHMWHQLQRRYLHPHYAVGILDETINQPSDSIQSAINRAIAGAFMGGSETAVTSNIMDKTYRIQRWYFDLMDIPYIDKADENIVVAHCKLHNDTSVEISQDGRLLATFVPNNRGLPDDTILAVYSLLSESLGECWFTKGFSPNAISVSISPLNQYVLVGLAAKRLAWVFSSTQLVAQVYRLCNKKQGEISMRHVTNIMHPCDSETRTQHISVNAAKWLPGPGQGLLYGTNRGDLHICRPGHKSPSTSTGDDLSPSAAPSSSSSMSSPNLRRNLMEMLGITVPRTISTATQTPLEQPRTTSTQTLMVGSDESSSDSDEGSPQEGETV